MKIAYKALVISGLIIGLFSVFTGLFAYIFANMIPFTVNKFQIWRLFTSFLVDQSIINVIFNLYIMSMCVPIIVSFPLSRNKCTPPRILSWRFSFKPCYATLCLSHTERYFLSWVWWTWLEWSAMGSFSWCSSSYGRRQPWILRNSLGFASSLASCQWNTFLGVFSLFFSSSESELTPLLPALQALSSTWSSSGPSFECLCPSIIKSKVGCLNQLRKTLALLPFDQSKPTSDLWAETLPLPLLPLATHLTPTRQWTTKCRWSARESQSAAVPL